MTRTLMLQDAPAAEDRFHLRPRRRCRGSGEVQRPRRVIAVDPEMQELLWLRSRNREQVVQVLRSEDGLTALLVPHVIPLLAWDAVAAEAVFALRKVAEEHIGQLSDALIDPNQDFAVRRRLARVFSVCVSQRAVDGLMLGLDDLRFEVRFQCGRSLAAILDKNPVVHIDSGRIFAVVQRETAVGRPVWESRRLLDDVQVWEGVPVVDEFVRDRAGQSLAHVFTLLSLVLPREPLQIAFRACTPTISICGERRSSISKACCRRHPRAAVAVPGGRPAASRGRRGRAKRYSPICCDRTSRSCSISRS